MTQREIARAARAARRERERFYIQLSVTGSHLGGYRWARYAWPKLFRTEREAEEFAAACNPFKNAAAIPGRGRIKSFSIQKVTLCPRT